MGIEEKQRECEEQLETILNAKADSMPDNSSQEEKWEYIKTSILEACKYLGVNDNRKTNIWFDAECGAARKIHDEDIMRAITTPNVRNRVTYKLKRKETKRLIRKKKRVAQKSRKKH